MFNFFKIGPDTLCLIALLLFISQMINCQQQSPSQYAQSPENELMLQVAQKLLANIDNFPEAISDGISGNPNGIRRLVTSALGNGVIGRLMENPLDAVSGLGLDVEQLVGLNRTFLERYLGKFGLAQLAGPKTESESPSGPKHENFFAVGNERNGDGDTESTLLFGGKKPYAKNSLYSNFARPGTPFDADTKSSPFEQEYPEQDRIINDGGRVPYYKTEFVQENMPQQLPDQLPSSDYWVKRNVQPMDVDQEKWISKRSENFAERPIRIRSMKKYRKKLIVA